MSDDDHRHPDLTVVLEEMKVGWLPAFVDSCERQALPSPALGDWPFAVSGGALTKAEALGITEEDLRTDKYDFAEVRMSLVNYQDLGQGILKVRRLARRGDDPGRHVRRRAARHDPEAADDGRRDLHAGLRR